MIYAFPLAAGVKMRGCNLAPYPPDLTDPGLDTWYVFQYAWGTGASPDRWDTWIKPCIDAAVSVGANCLRVIFDATLRVGTGRSHLTQGQLETILDQLLDYCASVGMWVYFCPTSSYQNDDETTNFGLTTALLEEFIAEFVAFTSLYPNVLGYDVIQEVPASGFSFDNMEAAMDAAKGAMTTRTVPVTCSKVATADPCPIDIFYGPLGAGADFIDVHIYPFWGLYDALIVDELVFNEDGGIYGPAGANDIPVIVGELGVNIDEFSTGDAGDIYETYAAIAALARMQATMQWAVAFRSSTPGNNDDFGMFALDGSWQITGPRTYETIPYQTAPKVPGAYNALENAFATLGAAPMVTARTTSTVSLSWSGAVGGSGTVTYTPQRARVNADGFPVEDWVSGTPTTGTTATLSGLTTARYACRVRVSSAAA